MSNTTNNGQAMTEVEIVKIKITNILSAANFSKPKKHLFRELNEICNQILDEHKDSFNACSFHINTKWGNANWKQKIMLFLKGEYLKSKRITEVKCYLEIK